MTEKQIGLTDADQAAAFEAAKEQIAADLDAIDDDVRTWGGDPTDGEVVRVLAAAYQGSLSLEGDGSE